MALSDVQELSSLLRTEDLEKSELNRKKLSIDLAIKQQEGRLFYECEERDRCLREISLAYDKLCDISATFELKEIELHELGKQIQSHGGNLSLEAQLSQFQTAKADVTSTIDAIIGRVDHAMQMMEKLESNPAAVILKKKLDAESTLKHIDEKLVIVSHCIEESIASTAKKEEELIKLDAETADICGTIESTERQNKALDPTLLSEEGEMHRLKTIAAAHKAENAQADFKYSAELGKKAEAIAAQRDKIKEEEKTSAALEKESAELTLVVETALQHAQSLDEQLTQTQRSLEQGRIDRSAFENRKASLRQTHASLMSELAAANHLCQTVALQSFKSRADDLTKELQEVNLANECAQAELRALEEQLADNKLHPVLHDLLQRCTTTAQEHTITQERRGLLHQELEVRQLRLPALLAEKLALETRLAENHTICAEVASQLQTLQAQVQTLTVEQASREPVAETQERIAAFEREHTRAVAEKAQCEAETREVQGLIEQELASLQHAVQERSLAAIAAALNKDKLKRVASAKENLSNLHRQAVAKLRKVLMDEDKHFQLTQQQERADHDTAMSQLAQEKRVVDAELAQIEAELSALQQELTGEASLCPVSQLPALDDLAIAPAAEASVTTSALLAQRSQRGQSQSQCAMPAVSGLQTDDPRAAQETNKRAKHAHADGAPPTAATTEAAAEMTMTENEPVAVGKKTTKKKRKL